jgi:hypothetical protein
MGMPGYTNDPLVLDVGCGTSYLVAPKWDPKSRIRPLTQHVTPTG